MTAEKSSKVSLLLNVLASIRIELTLEKLQGLSTQAPNSTQPITAENCNASSLAKCLGFMTMELIFENFYLVGGAWIIVA